jgi:hypothetical protein
MTRSFQRSTRADIGASTRARGPAPEPISRCRAAYSHPQASSSATAARSRKVSRFVSATAPTTWSWMSPRTGLPSVGTCTWRGGARRGVAWGCAARRGVGMRGAAWRGCLQGCAEARLELLVRMHNCVALCAPLLLLWQVKVDFVAVKVGVEGRTVGVVHADRALPLKHTRVVSHEACTRHSFVSNEPYAISQAHQAQRGRGGELNRDSGDSSSWHLRLPGNHAAHACRPPQATTLHTHAPPQSVLQQSRRTGSLDRRDVGTGGTPGLCSVGCRFVSSTSPSSTCLHGAAAWGAAHASGA